MIIIGDEQLKNEKIIFCKNKELIIQNIELGLILIDSIELAKFCLNKNIKYISQSDNIIDMIYFASLGSEYIYSKNIEFCSEMQKVANEYILDSKIALGISDKIQIKEAISHGIDCVIFNDCIR